MPGCRWTTLDELTNRRAEWRTLASTSGFPSAYNDPSWILAWWHNYGDSHEPWLLVLEGHSGEMRGLVPLALRRSSLARTLTFAGNPWNGLETLLCAPGAEAELVTSLIAMLADRRSEWDVWRIERLPTDSLLAQSLLHGDLELRASAHDLRLQPLLELSTDADTFESRFPGKRRNEFRRRWRKLLDLGAQARLISDTEDAQTTIAEILDMRRAWAATNGQNHTQLDTRFERFMNDAVNHFMPEGVRLWSLELNGKILTAKLNFVEGPREHGYLSGLNNEQLSLLTGQALDRLSPGHALERHVILAMIDERRGEFDYGAGRDSYKYRWGAIDRELTRTVVASPTLRGRLAGTRAATDLRLRDTAAAEAMRRRRGIIPERATRDHPAVTR